MFELYSRRNRNIEDDPDVYEYDLLNEKLRTQLYIAFEDVMDEFNLILIDNTIFEGLYKRVKKEFGVFSLKTRYEKFPKADFKEFWMTCDSIDFIDITDLTIGYISNIASVRKAHYYSDDFQTIALKMNMEMNHRMKQHNLGYEIINDKLIRIDNKLMHANIVKPVLYFLQQEEFKGVEDEIYDAFDYLKDNDYKNTVLYASKAFESMMKTICKLKMYTYNNDKDTAKELINILVKNKYIPQYSQNHLHAVQNTLESGLPVLRNKTGGHGQGDAIVQLPTEFANYALNLACTNILFLAGLF